MPSALTPGTFFTSGLLIALAVLVGVFVGVHWLRRNLLQNQATWLIRELGLTGMIEKLSSGTKSEELALSIAAGRIEELLQQIRQAVIVIDAQDRLRVANRAAQELLRLTEKDTGASFVPLARSAELVDFLRLVRDGGGAMREIELHRAPAANLWVRISGAPLLADPSQIGSVVLVAEDITRLRRLEVLEREFVANVSHDLRTPVTILRGYAETLAQDQATMSTEERARFISKVVSSTGRLASLLEGMLALASLESGVVLQRQSGALLTAASEAKSELEDRAKALGIQLRLDVIGQNTGEADPIQSRRLVQNLIENALAHARSATEVTIRVRLDELEVEDNGMGVAPAELERLFDRFYRADRSRKQGGAGIGLSIVRQIAELHGGGVSAEPVRPKGLRIRVRLAPL